ncbi:hypothetical protein BS78_10G069900 [Paspalum vaginatum]|nr:hypothetical protein BS78_10G069900 [Paspalum vaginatum]
MSRMDVASGDGSLAVAIAASMAPEDLYARNSSCGTQVALRVGDSRRGPGTTTAHAGDELYPGLNEAVCDVTTAGVSFHVLADNDSKPPTQWLVLKPLTKEHWLTVVVFLFLGGFVLWMIDRVLQESNLIQFRTASYSIFSTLAFFHGKIVKNPLSVVVCYFVVLALLQSYTANFTSDLTVKWPPPSVPSLDQLVSNGDCNGYQEGSFVQSCLVKKVAKEDKLMPFKNRAEYGEAWRKESKNNGTAPANLDEIPHFPYFPSGEKNRECKTPETPGSCIVLPYWTSPFVPDLSVAIMNITEKTDMEKLRHPPHYDLCAFNSTYDELMFEEAEGDVSFYEISWLQASIESWSGYSAATMNLTIGEDSGFDNDSKPLDQLMISKLTPIPQIRWIFLKPLTKELWLTTVGFFFFTGFVLWMIERSINPEFQGSDLEQFSTASYFALSTLTFSHGQILRSPLSKTVVVIWCFAVLVLVSSYTAHLSSMIADETSTSNGGSASGPAPLTLQSFSGLFVLTGVISALMLLISVTKSVYARYYTRVRGSESQGATANGDGGSVGPPGEFSAAQDDTSNGSVPHQDQCPQVLMDNNDDPQDANDLISAGDVEAGPIQDRRMDNGSLHEVSVQIEMAGTGHGAGRVL